MNANENYCSFQLEQQLHIYTLFVWLNCSLTWDYLVFLLHESTSWLISNSHRPNGLLKHSGPDATSDALSCCTQCTWDRQALISAEICTSFLPPPNSLWQSRWSWTNAVKELHQPPCASVWCAFTPAAGVQAGMWRANTELIRKAEALSLAKKALVCPLCDAIFRFSPAKLFFLTLCSWTRVANFSSFSPHCSLSVCPPQLFESPLVQHQG